MATLIQPSFQKKKSVADSFFSSKQNKRILVCGGICVLKSIMGAPYSGVSLMCVCVVFPLPPPRLYYTCAATTEYRIIRIIRLPYYTVVYRIIQCYTVLLGAEYRIILYNYLYELFEFYNLAASPKSRISSQVYSSSLSDEPKPEALNLSVTRLGVIFPNPSPESPPFFK